MQEQISDAETNLKETEWDRYISETNDMLDDLYADYEETLNSRLDDIDALMVYMTDQINDRSKDIQNTMETVASDYGYDITEATKGIFGSEGNLITTFNGDFTKFASKVTDQFDNIIKIATDIASGKNAESIVQGESPNQPNGGKWQKNKDGSWWYQTNDAETAKNEYRNGYWLDSDGKWNGTEKKAQWKHNDKGWWYEYGNGKYPKNRWLKIDGKWYYFDENGYLVTDKKVGKYTVGADGAWKGYATGSKHITEDQLAWTQEKGSELIFRSSDGAMLTPLNKGDMVFTADMTKNLWDIAKNPAYANTTVKIPDSAVAARTINNENALTVVLPNVQSYDDFKEALMKDRQITNFMQSVTLGQALGKGKLNRGNL